MIACHRKIYAHRVASFDDLGFECLHIIHRSETTAGTMVRVVPMDDEVGPGQDSFLVFVGNWIVKENDVYKSYTDKQFHGNFAEAR